MREIKPMDGTAVRCEAAGCDCPARFLFIAAGKSGARWAYCPEHAAAKAAEANLPLPAEIGATAGSLW